MKKAVIYSRVSTDDQKEFGFSLQDQEARLIKHCRQKGYEIVKHYQDDHSAKDFNRPSFKQFLDDVKEKKVKAEVFLCVRMDRFSRNALDSMKMLETFRKWNIYFECIENHIDISSPESLIPFMLNLVLPEVDNKRRGLNTKRGLRQGLKEGRWMWKAPIGYINDVVNKLVVPNKETAPLVRWAFETYANGIYAGNEVWRQVCAKGLNMSKQKFYDMLVNPFYIGKIKLPAYDDEDEQMINAIHDPIINEEVFYKAQGILLGKKKGYKGSTKSEELPLKGYLICPRCGKLMTGSGSKGNGGIYHYYHCQRKYGCSNSFSAKEANEQFENYLNSFEISNNVIDLYKQILEDVFKSNDTERAKERIKLETEISNIDKKRKSLQEKFVDDILNESDYKEIKASLDDRKNDLISRHVTLTKTSSDFPKYISSGLPILADIGKYYSIAPTPIKSKIISSIFPENLIYEQKKYRTTKINEAFALICKTENVLRKQKPDCFVGLSTVAPQSGLEPETL